MNTLENCLTEVTDAANRVADNLVDIRDTIICPHDFTWVNRSSEWVNEKLSVIPNWNKGVYRFPLDGGSPNAYWTLSLEDAVKFVDWCWITNIQYVINRWDCENFGVGFTALSLLFHHFANKFGWNSAGMVMDWSGHHGYNIILTSIGDVYLVEIQNKRIWSLANHDYQGAYKLETADILF